MNDGCCRVFLVFCVPSDLPTVVVLIEQHFNPNIKETCCRLNAGPLAGRRRPSRVQTAVAPYP